MTRRRGSLSHFLAELQRERQHCAVVLDEHGTAIGLAFREDALEEIVGPLGDEFDEGAPELEDESEETIGGHVTALLGRLPRKGDTVRIGNYRASVLEVTRRRVARLRMTPVPGPEAGAEKPKAAD